MDYTFAIGNVVELQCISKFIEMGFQCSIPYGNNARYDFIADLNNGELIRVQCKTSSWVNDNLNPHSAFSFSCVTTTTNTQKTTRHAYTKEQIDYFATYFEGQVYLIPVDECSTSKTLRFEPPQNGQKKYNKASDYTIENMLAYLQDEKFITDINNYFKTAEVIKKVVKKGECPLCKTPVWKADSLCPTCYQLQSRRVERPSRETLKQLIRTLPFTTIAKQYHVSDNAIREWCDAVGLPRKSREIKRYTNEEWESI